MAWFGSFFGRWSCAACSPEFTTISPRRAHRPVTTRNRAGDGRGRAAPRPATIVAATLNRGAPPINERPRRIAEVYRSGRGHRAFNEGPRQARDELVTAPHAALVLSAVASSRTHRKECERCDAPLAEIAYDRVCALFRDIRVPCHPIMSTRTIEFAGFRWGVFEPPAKPLPSRSSDGAPSTRLYFLSRAGSRRADAYPRDWASLSDRELASLCADALSIGEHLPTA
jgi:hypothetical protein